MVIFSVLTFVALCLSICIRNRKKSLRMQTLSCIFESLYDFTIHAYTGAFLMIINTIRSILFINKKEFSKKTYLIILFIFESVIVINLFFSWAGPISLLPTIGSIVRTYSLWQTKMKLVRSTAVFSGLVFSLYYVYYHSWFIVLGYTLFFVISLYQVYTCDIKAKKKKYKRKNVRAVKMA